MQRPIRKTFTSDVKKETPLAKSFTIRWAQRVGFAVTTLTLLLSLLGYGYELVYLDELGIDPKALGLSAFDYLSRCWYPVVRIADQTSHLLTLDSLARGWTHTFYEKNLIWILLGLPVTTALGAFIYALVEPGQSRKQVVRGIKIASVYTALGRYACVRHGFGKTMDVIRCAMRQIFKLPVCFLNFLRRHYTQVRFWAYSGSVASLLIATLLVPAICLLVLFVVGGPMLGVISIPLIGGHAGKENAHRAIINAQVCAQPGKARKADWRDIATCVRILKDGKELDSGYYVDQGRGRIYVFRPCINQPISFELASVTIEHIGALPYKAKELGCTTYAQYKKQLSPVAPP